MGTKNAVNYFEHVFVIVIRYIWLEVLNFHQPSATWTSFEAELRELRSCEGMDVSPFSTARESQIVGRCFLWEVDGGMYWDASQNR